MDLRADHAPLPKLAETVLPVEDYPVRLVTFLNRSLKDRGFIFGLRRVDEGRFSLTIYEAGPPAGRGDGEG
ncbi:YpmA family protein [Caldinitratiruptor microaerophilus]|uniref:Uncharacterized protein n=1 Tax=Caldinitratiruptor microaerophilus TaxID=671077 RepID=A0AA35CMF8_9FIRM|nr:YpmA family protein [Caldinitratiruptor microaerophilus]BDG60041.1 hypothetical protein caldi_11310 [Caldinitratiruptor microaerophilus]